MITQAPQHPAAVQPFGDLSMANILVIGHDPTLQHSDAQAQYAFFLEYLTRKPVNKAQVSQSNFAKRLLVYLSWLAGREVPASALYATNLCNAFLPRRAQGVIYIPEEQARQGVAALSGLVEQGHFKVILPMAEQVFYWLCQLGFVDRPDPRVDRYLSHAAPQTAWAAKGLYKKTRGTPFVEVCGERFSHRGTPVVPILHLNRWKERFVGSWVKYNAGMARAQAAVRQILAPPPA